MTFIARWPMADQQTHHITLLIEQLQSTDTDVKAEAKRRLIEEYSADLQARVQKELGSRVIRRGEEPQAIADSALRIIVSRTNSGIKTRDSFWKLLSTIALNKANSAARRAHAAKRDINREEHFDGDARQQQNQM